MNMIYLCELMQIRMDIINDFIFQFKEEKKDKQLNSKFAILQKNIACLQKEWNLIIFQN